MILDRKASRLKIVPVYCENIKIDFWLEFLCRYFVNSRKSATFAKEFIPHLREGNRKTQAIEALRFLLL